MYNFYFIFVLFNRFKDQPELNKRIDLKKKKMKSEIMKTDGNVSTYNESQNKPYFLTKSQMKFNQSISNSKNISTLQEERLASKKSSIAHINEVVLNLC